jgi:hypothetical protein
MPSRPLKGDTAAEVRLQTRTDVEAINVAKGRREMPAAVARLAHGPATCRQLHDPSMSRSGSQDRGLQLYWYEVS